MGNNITLSELQYKQALYAYAKNTGRKYLRMVPYTLQNWGAML
jgi:hypothetical protein